MPSQLDVNRIDRASADARQASRIRSRKVESEIADA